MVVIPQDGVKSKFINFSRRAFINAAVLLEMHACVMEYLVLCIDELRPDAGIYILWSTACSFKLLHSCS